MKKLMKIFGTLLACATIPLLYSCTEEIEYTPGEQDLEGCYKVYFPEQETDLTLDPDDPTELVLTVCRENTADAITVPYEFTDPDGVFVVTNNIVFAAGEDETEITVTFDDAEIGTSYSCIIEVTDPQYVSQYSQNATGIDITVLRDKWNDLEGYAVFHDDFFFEDSYEVEIQQNDVNPHKFRLHWPYAEGLVEEEYVDDGDQYGGDEYLTFTVLQTGNTINETTISTADLVYWDDFDTGWNNPSYDANVKIYHPSAFSSYQDESDWTKSYVLSYQNDGIPAQVQLAPYYYMDGVGGWNYSQYDGMIIITFPGAADYSLNIEAGETSNGEVPISFTLGADVASVKYEVYEGTLSAATVSANAEEIAADEDAKTLPETGAISLNLGTTGIYTIVAVSFDENGEAQETASCEFCYLAAGDEMPVSIGVELNATNKYAADGKTTDNTLELFIYGLDLASVKYDLVKTEEWESDPDGVLEDILESDEVSSNVLATINASGGYSGVLSVTPATSYTVVVWASNGYESTVVTAEATTTGTWVEYGTGDYTYTLYFVDYEYDEDADDYVYDEDGYPIVIPFVDEGLTLSYIDAENPTQWKISHWGYDVDFLFTYDAQTGKVQVNDQPTGDYYYGPVYVDDVANESDFFDYYGYEVEEYSHFDEEENAFYFAVMYYDNYYIYDWGYETFALNSDGASTASVKTGSKTFNLKTNMRPVKATYERSKSDKIVATDSSNREATVATCSVKAISKVTVPQKAAAKKAVKF